MQLCLFSLILRLRRAQTAHVDERVRLLSDIIGSIRSVKLFAWEMHFGREVSKIRAAEHKELGVYSLTRPTVNAIFDSVPLLASVSECREGIHAGRG